MESLVIFTDMIQLDRAMCEFKAPVFQPSIQSFAVGCVRSERTAYATHGMLIHECSPICQRSCTWSVGFVCYLWSGPFTAQCFCDGVVQLLSIKKFRPLINNCSQYTADSLTNLRMWARFTLSYLYVE